VPYALPKLDMIAIPDFAAGAMENYGLVTYRETALLYDDQHSAAANKQRVGPLTKIGFGRQTVIDIMYDCFG